MKSKEEKNKLIKKKRNFFSNIYIYIYIHTYIHTYIKSKSAIFTRPRNFANTLKRYPSPYDKDQASALALTDEIHRAILFWEKYLAPKIDVLNVFSFLCFFYVKLQSVTLFSLQSLSVSLK